MSGVCRGVVDGAYGGGWLPTFRHIGPVVKGQAVCRETSIRNRPTTRNIAGKKGLWKESHGLVW